MAIGPDQHRLCDDHGHFMVSWGSVTNCPVCGKRCKAHPHYHKKAAFHFIGAGNGYFSKALGREEHINNGVEMGEAIAMVYSADRCLSGELDEIYDNQIDLTP